MPQEFRQFPKIPRLSRPCVVTEKIDGTNASIYIGPDGEFLIGSRTRWITPDTDNYGFAKWATEHREELMQLGPGHHFGEWWGSGIQRGYGLREKRFSLFNTSVWNGDNVPPCCSVVPILDVGPFSTFNIQVCLDALARDGSVAAPGYMNPEGVVVYHLGSNSYFKKTILNDDSPKSMNG